MDDVLPRGRHVEFDTEAYIGEMVHNETPSPADNVPMNDQSLMEDSTDA